LLTDDREIYERAIIFAHYERHSEITLDYLKKGAGIPWGGCKYRMHQLSSAVGVVKIKYFKEEIEEIDKAMNYFCDLLDEIPGIKTHRPPKNSGSTKGAWYHPVAFLEKEKLEGLSLTRFCEAMRAEGIPVFPGCNKPLHLHPLFHTIDVYNDGKPTNLRNIKENIIQSKGSLSVSESIGKRVFTIPLFRKFKPSIIEKYASGFEKVLRNYKELLKDDKGDPEEVGKWGLTFGI